MIHTTLTKVTQAVTLLEPNSPEERLLDNEEVEADDRGPYNIWLLPIKIGLLPKNNFHILATLNIFLWGF